MKKHTLWSYDFTVITIGSFVSLVGSILSSFAVSLLILDHTGSTFLYMLYNAAYPVPMMICPVLAGPYLDRASRKKVIYCLDFLSSGIYLMLFLLLKEGWFSYPALLAVNVLTGAVRSVYSVAYDSFYPNLIAGETSERLMLWQVCWRMPRIWSIRWPRLSIRRSAVPRRCLRSMRSVSLPRLALR